MIAVSDQSLNMEDPREHASVGSSAFDPEVVLAEFQRRYEDGSRPKPRTAKLLFEDNPDLGGYYAVLNVKARDFFGRTLGKELVARGLIDKGVAKRDPQPTEPAGQRAPLFMSGASRGPLSLEERRERAVADLKNYYPDGRIARLDADHKKLGERLRKLYRELGYSSRREMIESFGFEMPSEKGGRPRSCDFETVLAELQRRYEDEGKPRPRTTKALFEENPDLAEHYEALNSGARKFFGRSLGKELEARGLVDRGSSRSSDAEAARGARVERRESETAELLAALGDMEQRLADVPVDERPSTLTSLCERFPEYEGLISQGRRRGIVSKQILFDRGILGLSKSRVAAQRKSARLSHIRNQELPALLERYESLDGPPFVDGENHGELLGDGVLGYDLATMSELRETKIPVENIWPLSVGEAPSVRFAQYENASRYSPQGRLIISCGADQTGESGMSLDVVSFDEFVSAERFEGETPFATIEGAQVEAELMLAGIPFAVLRYRFVVPLSARTLLYALHALGVPVV